MRAQNLFDIGWMIVNVVTYQSDNIRRAMAICKSHSPFDMITKVGAFYNFNKDNGRYLSQSHVIRFIIENSDGMVTKRISPIMVKNLIELLNVVRESIIPGYASREEQLEQAIKAGSQPINLRLNADFLSSTTTSITNNGSDGDMLILAIDKYAPFKDLLQAKLGFDMRSAAITMALLERYSHNCMHQMSKLSKQRHDEMPLRVIQSLQIPPKDFIEAWERGTVLSEEVIGVKYHGFDFNWDVIRFLTTTLEDLRSDARRFARWAFILNPRNEYQLVLGNTLIECLVSACHFEIISRLDDTSKGEFTKKVGGIFEGIVRKEFESRWKGSKASRRIKIKDDQDRDIGDIDSVINLQHYRILVECKGAALRPKGRWGNTDYLDYDVKNNILDAATKLNHLFRQKPELWDGVEATLIVVDQYIPSMTLFLERDPDVKKLTKDIHNLISLTYYELRYLLRRMDEKTFQQYLQWRRDYVIRTLAMPLDEMDVMYSYLFHRNDIDLDAKEPVLPIFLSDDTTYIKETYLEFLMKLGLIP